MSKNLTEVMDNRVGDNKPKTTKTGFEASLEGAQDWPPRSFRVKLQEFDDKIIDKMTDSIVSKL